MSVTSKLKRGVDIPVFEWLRALPSSTGGLSQLTSDGTGNSKGRYLYYQINNSSAFSRYDTYSDSWNTLSNSVLTFSTIGNSTYNQKQGYYGRVIEAIGSNKIRVAVPIGSKSVGLTIKIISGTGAGQSKTISAVAEPTVHDTLVFTSGNTNTFTDSNKNYSRNIWRDYMMRIIGNTNTDFRKILYNSNNALVFADARFDTYGVQWSYAPLTYNLISTSGSQTIAQIESYVVTVDSDWSITPDNTSVFVIESGALFSINGAVSRWGAQVYDVLADTWYQKNSPSNGYYTGNLLTDTSIESLYESTGGPLLSGNVVSATSRTLTDTSLSLSPNIYNNYLLRIKSGAGFGQEVPIISHTSNTFTIFSDWKVTPNDTSVYDIVVDTDKMFMIGGFAATTLEYDAIHGVWSDRRILDVSTVSNLHAVWNGYNKPISIATITRTGTVATVTTTHPHGIKTNETVTIGGATDALYNITATIIATGDNTFTYNLGGTPAANAVAIASQSATLLVDNTKNWVTNELVGKMVTFLTAPTNTSHNVVYYHKLITANTAKTISFATGNIPTVGALYFITDAVHLGSIASSAVGAGATTQVLPLVSGTYATNILTGRRIVITDNTNSIEGIVASNTSNSITLVSALGFTPTTNAVISVLGNNPTGQGCHIQHLFNPSTLQKGRYLFSIRGGGTNTLSRYDISTNTWAILGQTPSGETYSTGTTCNYDGDDRIYIQRDITGRISYYDLTGNSVYAVGTVPYGMGSSTIGNKLPIVQSEDGLKFIYIPRYSGQEFWRLMLWT
jgi:hypothetical protein